MRLPIGSSVILVLPWPPSCLLPNAKRRTHWTKYQGPANQYKNDCWILAREAMGRHHFDAPPAVDVAFFPPDARKRDDDGMIGAMKHGRDGIAAAIGYDDHTWLPKYSFHAPHRPHGKIIVTLTAQGRAEE